MQIFKVTIQVLISSHCLALVPMTFYIYSYKINLIHILVVASAVQETISGIG